MFVMLCQIPPTKPAGDNKIWKENLKDYYYSISDVFFQVPIM